MPKKTRKQKRTAQMRRKPLVLTFPSPSSQPAATRILAEQTKIKAPSQQASEEETFVFDEVNQTIPVFKHDLAKSLIITTILIIIQVGMYITAAYGIFDVSTIIRF